MLQKVASGGAGGTPTQGLNGRVILQKVIFFLCPLLPNSGRSGPGVAAADPLPSPVSLPPAQGVWHRAGAGSRGLASGGSLRPVGLARQLREVRKQWP